MISREGAASTVAAKLTAPVAPIIVSLDWLGIPLEKWSYLIAVIGGLVYIISGIVELNRRRLGVEKERLEIILAQLKLKEEERESNEHDISDKKG